MKQPKPGYKTTEWWAVVLTALVAVLPAFLSAFTEAQAGGQGVTASIAVAVAAAAYAFSRGKVKAQHADAEAQASGELGSQSDEDLADALEVE
jgi:hypothetical protein